MSTLPDLPVQTITTDMECIHCGYNLRGLQAGGRCPECGTEIQRSMQGNLLCFSDADWLRKLLLGVRMALWTIALTVLLFIGGFFCALAASIVNPALIRLMPYANLFGELMIGGVGLASLYLITSQEPRISLTEDPVTLRKALRTLGVVGYSAKLIQNAAGLAPRTAVVNAVAIIAAVVSLGWIVSYFGWFVYMRRFARRIPDDALAKSTTRLMWLSGITLGLSVIAGIAGAIIAFMFAGAGATGAPPFPGFPPLTTTAPATAPAVSPSGSAGESSAASDANVPTASTQPTSASSGSTVTLSTPGGTTRRRIRGPAAATAAILIGIFGCAFFIVMIVCGIWYLVLLLRYRDAFRGALAVAQQPE